MNLSNDTQKVVVVTDATSYDLQEYCSVFAARGAKLVLNYPPDSLSTRSLLPKQGFGSDRPCCDLETYESIREMNVAVARAVKSYGTVDVLVCDCSFRSPTSSYDLMSSSSWDHMRTRVINGAYKCAQAVWSHFRKQGSGKILFVDLYRSGYGIGETAARFAMFGLTQTLAQEGAKCNIQVNLIVPQAPSHVTGQQISTCTDPSISAFTALATSLIYGADEKNTGLLFTIDDAYLTKFRWERSRGVMLNPDTNFTAEALAKRWSEIDDFSDKCHPHSAMDFGNLLPQMRKLPDNPHLPSMSFSGRVVLVTGGASGLGRAYSIAFASLGASVIVNDRTDPQSVVDEILLGGGKAVSVIASVEQGDYIVRKALESYRSIDILINNAGFVRDKTFANMDESVWQSVMDVHLNGTYQMTKAVWPHFVRQRQGCIVNTTSTSGIYGNFGQANYSAAKLGILGISEATASEGRKHGIRVNTIAPVARTAALGAALSKTSDKNKQAVFLPEYIVPIVLVLCSETLKDGPNDVTGGLFEVGCGWHASTRLRPTSDYDRGSALQQTPITSSEPQQQHTKLAQSVKALTPSIVADKATLEIITGLRRVDIDHNQYKLTDQEVSLYNLSVGAKRSELSFVWEESESFQALPTFGVVPPFSMETIYHHGQILPKFQPMKSLLAEIYLEVLQDTIPLTGQLSTTRRLIEVLDKGNAAIAITGYTTSDVQTKKPLFYNEITFFMQGAGRFGGTRERAFPTVSSKKYVMPGRKADAVEVFKTSEEQAVLYRLTGDRMALHIAPEFSMKGGFSTPILHGMCFMGIAGRHLLLRYGPYYSIKVRFTSVVIPGQTLRTEMWESDIERDLVLFQVRVVESGKLCISGGWARLRAPLARSDAPKL